MRSLARAVTLSQQPSSLPPPPPPQTSLLTISHFLKACHDVWQQSQLFHGLLEGQNFSSFK